MLLGLIKLIIFARGISNSLNTSKEFMMDYCHTIDIYYNSLQKEIPHYMTKMGNYILSKTLNASVEASLNLLSMLVTTTEGVLLFMIEMWLGTYACLFFNAIHGTVEVATDVTETLLTYVNNTILEVASDLDIGLGSISSVVNKFLNFSNKFSDLLIDDADSDDTDDKNNEAKSNIEKFNLTIATLRNFNIPSSVNEKLHSLAENTPTFDDVKDKTKSLISESFKKIRQSIKSKNTTGMVDDKLLTVPPVYSLDIEGICSKNMPKIEKFYASLNETLKYALLGLILLISVCAILVMVPTAWGVYLEWKKLVELSHYSEKEQEIKNQYENDKETSQFDIIECHENLYHNYTSAFGKWIAYRLASSQKQVVEIQWLMAYVLSPRALMVFATAIAGLTIYFLQSILLIVLTHNLTSGKALHSLSEMTADSNIYISADIINWVANSNSMINSTEKTINEQMFSWLIIATDALNSTTTQFHKGIEGAIHKTFEGSPLHRTFNNIFACLIGNKIDAVENGITWVHDHARILLPRLNQDIMLNALLSNDSGSPRNSTTYNLSSKLNSLSNRVHDSVLRVIAHQNRLLNLELMISISIFIIWILQFPLGIIWLAIKRFRNLK